MKFNFFYILIILITLSCKKDLQDNNVPFIKVESYYPNSGREGTIFNIEGDFQGLNDDNLELFFGVNKANFILINKSQIIVRVPNGNNTVPIKLLSNGQFIEMGAFTYQDLSIVDIQPRTAVIGSEMRLRGTGFSSGAALPLISINSYETKVKMVSDTLILIEVLEGSGKGKVKIEIGDEVSEGPDVQYLNINVVSPNSGGMGTIIDVQAEGIGAFKDNIGASFNMAGFEFLGFQVPATVTNFTESSFQIIVPPMVGIGNLRIFINSSSLILYEKPFQVVPAPSIESVFPSAGIPGTEVTITGQYYSAKPNETKVFIGDTEVPLQSVSSNLIKFTVPSNIQSGKLKIWVNSLEILGGDFLIQNLFIKNFLPINGLSGSVVELLGNGFSTILSENEVSFNGVQAEVLTATSDRLSVRVPSNILSGKIKVKVGSLENITTSDFLIQGVFNLGLGSLSLSESGGSIAVDDLGNVYVLEIDRHAIKKITSNGSVEHFVGSLHGEKGLRDGFNSQVLLNLNKYSGIIYDPIDQILWLTESANSTVRAITKQGVVVHQKMPVELGKNCLIRDMGGYNYLIAGSLNNSDRINFFPYTGSHATFQNPSAFKTLIPKNYLDIGITNFENGDLFVPGPSFLYNESVITKYSNGGNMFMFYTEGRDLEWAGNIYSRGYADGTGKNALFNTIRSMKAIPNTNNILILDQGNFALRKANGFSADVSTVFKLENGFADGDFRTAKISNNVSDMAVSPDGKYCYILDNGNNCVRKVQLY